MGEHIPVLLAETIENLNIKENGIYVDCTMGGAGHSSEILKKIKTGHLYCFDQDDFAIKKGIEKLSKISSNFTIIKDNFVNLKKRLSELNITKVDGILYDLGVSSFQFDIAERGFSYNNDAPLDMRMNQENELTAEYIVNNYTFEELKKIFFRYGEEKFSLQIARNIEKSRSIKPIKTTFELVEIIKKALPQSVLRKKGHPAKQVFQALRIEVNNELNVFEKSLKDAFDLLNNEGRIAVITFHSLEDRICKQLFKEKVDINIPRGIPIKDCEINREYKLVNSKVIIAGEDELKNNNRAHSAKLRVIKKL